jgi:hypothetical protein
MKTKYVKFTPNVPIQRDDKGRDIQVVDGKVCVLYPPDVSEIKSLQSQGMPDDEIRDWLDMP